MTRKSSWYHALALLLALPACAVTHRDFRPVERATAEARSGRPAAEYQLGRDGVRWGEVRVWSEGATRFDDDQPEQTLLHVGIEVENVLDTPLALDLDQTAVTSAEVGADELADLRPLGADGMLETPPHAVRRFELEFALPDGVMPDDLHGFQVRWNLVGPEGWRYEQYTGFRRDRRPNYHNYPHSYWVWSPWGFGYRGFWGPYWGPYWGSYWCF